jgi:hypothetical protein
VSARARIRLALAAGLVAVTLAGCGATTVKTSGSVRVEAGVRS